MNVNPLYPEPNPVITGKGQLAWAQEMHQTNIRVAAERAGILDLTKPKKPKWWLSRNKADPEPKQPQQSQI